MVESVELLRILDVSGTLLNSTCRQNSTIASISIMAKLRPPEKTELKLLPVKLEHSFDKLSLSANSTVTEKSLSVDSSRSPSYSSSPEDTNEYSIGKDKLFEDIKSLIDGVKQIDIFENDSENDRSTLENIIKCTRNIVVSDDENSEKLSDDDEDENEEDEHDEGLIERGPVRPQFNPLHQRANPYVNSICVRPYSGIVPPENLTDYDTSAKEILTDQEYRQKIDSCLDKLSDMSQEHSMTNSLSPTGSDFGSASAYSPYQQQTVQQHWQQLDRSPTGPNSSPSYIVPSITVNGDSENALLEILSRGGFQSAQAARTPEYTSGASNACGFDACPDSPASSYNACANSSASRSDSRASSRAQSPGSVNGSINGSVNGSVCGPSFLNVLGSPTGSPQVSPQNFRCYPRPSSSSSSGQSYCETPSPANYQNPLDQCVEEQLGDHMMTRLPAWKESFESSETLVNSVDSNELQLQLVEEVIQGEMNGSMKNHDMQVVPNCRTAPNTVNNCSMINNNSVISPISCLENCDDTDDLTNTLLRFVGGEQSIGSNRKVESNSNSTTSGYSSSSSTGSEIKRSCDVNCVPVDPTRKNNFLATSRCSMKQMQSQQTVYQSQRMNISTTMNLENVQFSTTSVELMGKNTWQNYDRCNSVLGNSPVNNNFNEFQIPETVASYNSQRSNSFGKSAKRMVNGERSIAPWPSLNLPSTGASERLKEMTDPLEVEKAMKNLLKKPLDVLAKGDEDGDTMLMCLVGNPMELKKKLAYLVPLVERLSTIDGALSMINNRGEDALYLAAMNCPQMAFVAGYLAATFLQKNIDIGQRLYRSRGDTLIHALAAKGDSHGEVLAELLSLKTPQQNAVFDLSKRNYDGRTALHVATEAHESLGRNAKTISIGIVRLLLENGSDPTIREVRCGDTALHIAVSLSCDPSLVKALLTGRGREAVNVTNYNGNTPLHLAASISDRTSLDRQSEICWLLIHAGSRTNITNRQGKTPLALASAERKDPLRRIFHKKT